MIFLKITINPKRWTMIDMFGGTLSKSKIVKSNSDIENISIVVARLRFFIKNVYDKIKSNCNR